KLGGRAPEFGDRLPADNLETVAADPKAVQVSGVYAAKHPTRRRRGDARQVVGSSNGTYLPPGGGFAWDETGAGAARGGRRAAPKGSARLAPAGRNPRR